MAAKKITPEGKFKFLGALLGGDYRKDGETFTQTDKIQVRLLFQNIATFPIKFIVEDFSSTTDGRNSTITAPRADKGSIVQANEVKFYGDHLIDVGTYAASEICTPGGRQ